MPSPEPSGQRDASTAAVVAAVVAADVAALRAENDGLREAVARLETAASAERSHRTASDAELRRLHGCLAAAVAALRTDILAASGASLSAASATPAGATTPGPGRWAQAALAALTPIAAGGGGESPPPTFAFADAAAMAAAVAGAASGGAERRLFSAGEIGGGAPNFDIAARRTATPPEALRAGSRPPPRAALSPLPALSDASAVGDDSAFGGGARSPSAVAAARIRGDGGLAAALAADQRNSFAGGGSFFGSADASVRSVPYSLLSTSALLGEASTVLRRHSEEAASGRRAGSASASARRLGSGAGSPAFAASPPSLATLAAALSGASGGRYDGRTPAPFCPPNSAAPRVAPRGGALAVARRSPQ